MALIPERFVSMRPEMVEPIGDDELAKLKASVLGRWERKTHFLNDLPKAGDSLNSPALTMRADEVLSLILRLERAEAAAITEEDARLLRLAKDRQASITEDFRLKSQCGDCGYQSMDIYPEQGLLCPMNDCHGSMVELKQAPLRGN